MPYYISALETTMASDVLSLRAHSSDRRKVVLEVKDDLVKMRPGQEVTVPIVALLDSLVEVGAIVSFVVPNGIREMSKEQKIVHTLLICDGYEEDSRLYASEFEDPDGDYYKNARALIREGLIRE